MKKHNDLTIQALSHEKLPQFVAEKIKELIFSNRITTGQKLPSERDLANQFKISRTMVREGLNSLVYSGLIEIRRGPAGGAYVVDNLHKPLLGSAIDLMRSGRVDLQQALDTRKILECAGIRLASEKITEEDLWKLNVINDEYFQNLKRIALMHKGNSLFHLTLIGFSENVLITTMLKSLLEFMAEQSKKYGISTMTQSKMKEIHKEHGDIIKAIRKKDLVQCEYLLGSHIDQTKTLVSPKVIRKTL